MRFGNGRNIEFCPHGAGQAKLTTLLDRTCFVASRWMEVSASSGVDVSSDTASERGEASAVVRHAGRVDLEPLG